MRTRDRTPLWRRRRVRSAVAVFAGLTALALPAATGYGESDGPATIAAAAPAPDLGPFPDPGDGLTDPGTPGNPPPPEGGIGAPGPGSPDSGATLASAHGDESCVLQPNEDEKQCFKLAGATQFIVQNVPGHEVAGGSVAIVEKLASDGTVLRTSKTIEVREIRPISFMPNTTVTIVNRSPYPRVRPTEVIFVQGRASHDFLCEVPIHNPYLPDDWQNHAKCTWTGANSWLALFTNYGDRPVDVNEWYRGNRHGRTEVRPGEPKVLPLHSHGQFWVGAGGPPGPPIKLSVTNYRIANELDEMWVRDETGRNGSLRAKVAVNLSPYKVTLSWLGPNPDSVVLSPNGRATIPPYHVTGRKPYSNGEVARVLFNPDDSGTDTQYTVTIPPPPGHDEEDSIWPHSTIAWLGNAWRSVQVKNLGPRRVGLASWLLEGYVGIGEVWLNSGATGILPLFDYNKGLPATSITGVVDPTQVGNFTDVLASQWVPCRSFFDCSTRFTPTLNSLTGSATGLDADQVQLSMRGRLTLARSAGEPDLARASIDLLSVLDEAGGAGELVDATASRSVHLVPSRSRGSTTVFVETRPAGARPLFRMEVTRRSGRVLDFTLNVATSALSHGPELCSTAQPPVTDLATRFIISDDRRPPVDFATLKPWECVGNEPQQPRALLLQ
jgi:hypothetical protein